MQSIKKKFEQNISKLYKNYFLENNIDVSTGIIKNYNLKFASYPFIGSKYGSGKYPKILFVGLDIGKDESLGRILGYSEKRKSIEGANYNLKKLNPHIAGTYNTIIFYLRNGLLKKEWDMVKLAKGYKEGIRIFQSNKEDNLLSYVSLTNLFKFVTPKRKPRLGGENRRHISKDKEIMLLREEIDIFSPEVVIFQSNQFKTNKHYQNLVKELVKKQKFEVIVGAHPTYWGGRNPLDFSKTLLRSKIS